MTDHKQHLTNEHVALLQTTIHKLIKYPRLVDELTVAEVINLSTFSRRIHYSIPFPFLQGCSFTTMHPMWGCDKSSKPHCLPLYHRFQELGSKYNLKQFIQCVNYLP
jgi:hypothetical protein